MADSMIRWSKGDYISLGKAVSNFNKKIKELQKEEDKLYLPELVNYKALKENIKTRKELNRQIQSLKRFQEEGAEDLIKTVSGETLSKWEYENLKQQQKIAERSLSKSAKELEKPFSSGYSKAQMGAIEYREVVANLRSIRNLDKKMGKEFKTIKERIMKFGTYDYEMIKATIYRENYMKALEESGAKNFKNYKLLEKKFNQIKNPVKFFKFIQRSNVMADLFLYYKEGYGIVYGFASDEERFNWGLMELGLLNLDNVEE